MSYSAFAQTLICILIAGVTVCLFIDKQNELTELRLTLPALAKEVRQIQEKNIRLQYEINQFESPIHLMELARKPEFGHLKYPYLNTIMTIPLTPVLNTEQEAKP